MLAVRDERRGRSKSPSGRDRSASRGKRERSTSRDLRARSTSRDNRDRSRDGRTKSPPRKEEEKENTKPGRERSNSEFEGKDRRRREKAPSTKEDDSSPDGRKPRSRANSRSYEGYQIEESDRRHRKSFSKNGNDDGLDDMGISSRDERRTSHQVSGQVLEDDHTREQSSRSSKMYSPSENHEELKDTSRRRHSRSKDPPTASSKEQRDGYEDGSHPSYARPPPFTYAQPAPSGQDRYYGQTPIYPPSPNPGPPQLRPDGFVDPRHEDWREQGPLAPEVGRSNFVPPGGVPSNSLQYPTGGAYPISPPAEYPDYQRGIPNHSDNAGQYVQPAPYQYAQVDPNVKYTSKSPQTYVQNPQHEHGKQPYTQTPYPQFADVRPETGSRESRDKRRQHYKAEGGPSSRELASRLGRLSVATGAGAAAGMAYLGSSPTQNIGDRPPTSPMLEAYRGTYQSISPMPSPMMLAKDKRNDSDLSDLSDLDSSRRKKDKEPKKKSSKPKQSDQTKETVIEYSDKRHRPSNASISGGGAEMVVARTPRTPKKVSFYDPTPDAIKIASALGGTHRSPDTEPLISILPSLSTDDMISLRAEYKNHAKTSGKGINMAKHIKMRVPGNLGKAAYATALGRWESEAYWANSWYQSGGSRRELLIESLMGRSNSDIREIKNCFRDKRYHDDLERCMRSELSADKFRMAILLVLEENRMSDTAPLDPDLVAEDVVSLHSALNSRSGGETAMIETIILRSDPHLRAVLRTFESTYHVNFPRAMISRSRNLVGETLAHVLNGALNRPMRDALLLHQAIAEISSSSAPSSNLISPTASSKSRDRAELLISRCIRLHWDPRHMDRVLSVYADRYDTTVASALRRQLRTTSGPETRAWVSFVAGCLGLLDDPDWTGDGSRSRATSDSRRHHRSSHQTSGRDSHDNRESNRDRERERDRDRDRDRDRRRSKDDNGDNDGADSSPNESRRRHRRRRSSGGGGSSGNKTTYVIGNNSSKSGGGAVPLRELRPTYE